MQAAKLIGLVRDALVSGISVYVLFGGHITNEQDVALAGLVTTVAALGSYILSNVNSPKGSV